MRPVGELEHRENLLDFVSWATGGSTGERTGCSAGERTGSSTGENAKEADDPKSTIKSDHSVKVENPGETGSQEEKQVCAYRLR